VVTRPRLQVLLDGAKATGSDDDGREFRRVVLSDAGRSTHLRAPAAIFPFWITAPAVRKLHLRRRMLLYDWIVESSPLGLQGTNNGVSLYDDDANVKIHRDISSRAGHYLSSFRPRTRIFNSSSGKSRSRPSDAPLMRIRTLGENALDGAEMSTTHGSGLGALLAELSGKSWWLANRYTRCPPSQPTFMTTAWKIYGIASTPERFLTRE